MTPASKQAVERERKLALQSFLPYRLSVLSNTTSSALARLYSERYDITIPEWRVMAVLGGGQSLCANDVCGLTAMDKVQVSRAIARMIKGGLVTRAVDRSDRRRAVLKLTRKGLDIYAEIAPAAIAYEDRLLGVLSAEEQAQLDRLMARLMARAVEIGAEMGGDAQA